MLRHFFAKHLPFHDISHKMMESTDLSFSLKSKQSKKGFGKELKFISGILMI